MLRRNKSMVRRCSPQKGFTIIELLTVMSIIIILIAILVPSLNRVRLYAKVVGQHHQFHEIRKGLELYRNEHSDTFPDSDAFDVNSEPYCGAMRLCEAMIGQDGMGFYPDSKFTADAGFDPLDTTGILRMYPFNLCTKYTAVYTPSQQTNLRVRRSYIDPEKITAYRIVDVYGAGNIAPFVEDNDHPNAVISDVFLRPTIVNTNCGTSGEKVGMPVIYYKANTSMIDHSTTSVNYPLDNIYKYTDNDSLTELGLPWEPPVSRTTLHPLYSGSDVTAGNVRGTTFVRVTTNKKVTATPKSHREDSYILMSAGPDGMYGTSDDVFNFTD